MEISISTGVYHTKGYKEIFHLIAVREAFLEGLMNYFSL